MNHDVRRGAFAALGLLLGLSATTRALAADDVVFLKNGGRIRGVVVEEDPQKGVRLKLFDGTFRTVKAADLDHVQYAGSPAPAPAAATPPPAEAPPPAPVTVQPVAVAPLAPFGPATGTLHVESAKPGTVYVDGGEAGHTPLDVHNLAARKHRVKVEFDEGGSDEHTVFVSANDTNTVSATMSSEREAFNKWRAGTHFGVSVEPSLLVAWARGFYSYSYSGAVYSPSDVGTLTYFGARVTGVMNVGLAPALDFRLAAFLEADQGSYGQIVPVGGIVAIRLNIGSVYSAELGVQAGDAGATQLNYAQHCTAYGAYPSNQVGPTSQICRRLALQGGGFGGPEWSLLSFRFGERRQIEAEFRQSLMIGDTVWLQNGLVLRYFFVPEATP